MPKSKTNNKVLFDSDVEDDYTFKTNTSYAKHYNEFRKKEILSHLKNISDESTSEDDASTDEELVNPEFEKEFFNAMAYLKNKDESKYKEIPSFFKELPTVEETVKNKQQVKSQKPITVADHQRDRLLKTKGLMSDDEDDGTSKSPEDMSYVAEQEKIKSDLKKALNSSDDEDDFLQVRSKTSEELQQEQTDYKKWLLEQKNSKTFKPLKDFWTSNELSKEDKFLRDYILNQKYLDNGDDSNYKDLIDIEDDEAEIEKQAEYEHKYNFRYEEPDNEFIKRFPRKIDDSVRIEDTKRKEKRKERDERKAKEKELKMKELRELQSIRKREIEEQLLILKDVSGRDDFQLKEEDLNSDFDPAEHDKRMSAMFNNEYYGIDDDEEKPQFPDIDEELNIEDWDNFDKNKIPSTENHEDVEPHCEDDDFNMDCDYDPQKEKREKLQRELMDMTKGRKRKKKISKLAEIIKKEKPAYDPTTGKTYEEYLDEYYKLDYEDIIGDTPCRFNYVECVPNDFGLTVEEILMASNKELNQWASLKKTMQNRPKNVEMNDVEKYNRKRSNLDLKKKIFKSIFGETNSDNEDDSSAEQKTEEIPQTTENTVAVKKKKKKNKRKKSANNSATSQQEAAKSFQENQDTRQNSQHNADEDHKKSKNKTIDQQKPVDERTSADKLKREIPGPSNNKQNKKRKFHDMESGSAAKHNNNNTNFKKRKFDQMQGSASGDSRLKAFGINPKKFYNKIKYGGHQKQHQKSQQVNKKKGKFKKQKN